ncbi:MAG: 30S ribosomal protein S7 [Acidobacteriia bacterium]|nr:30S ribosomal protein S7 [Terriglobia bacterium]MYG01501.1 30S ribosomal protein S7 [Terriglobia bacterium]MYK08924.1 30S ribosomal protein S7 [Terriglobia bacterium]
MPRRREVPVRVPVPDPVFNSTLVSKFINCMMWDGKKSVSERIFYEAMERIRSSTGEDPLPIFKKAVENAKPVVEVKSRRVGGANYQVPIEVRPNRRQSLALRWLIGNARNRSENRMADRLGNELLETAQGRGTTIKKKDDVHRMAEANKAFAHFRW